MMKEVGRYVFVGFKEENSCQDYGRMRLVCSGEEIGLSDITSSSFAVKFFDKICVVVYA